MFLLSISSFGFLSRQTHTLWVFLPSLFLARTLSCTGFSLSVYVYLNLSDKIWEDCIFMHSWLNIVESSSSLKKLSDFGLTFDTHEWSLQELMLQTINLKNPLRTSICAFDGWSALSHTRQAFWEFGIYRIFASAVKTLHLREAWGATVARCKLSMFDVSTIFEGRSSGVSTSRPGLHSGDSHRFSDNQFI